MKKLLWVGDAGVPSGFAKATHHILDTVSLTYDTNVLGINYRGDPHKYPYPIWAAAIGGDFMGVGRIVWMCDYIRQETGTPPDVIVLLNDGWNIQPYLRRLRMKNPDGSFSWPEYAKIPIVVMCAVDGKNFDGEWLHGVDHTIFWTHFALNEAREGGYVGSASVIPLGVDLDMYKPISRTEALKIKRLPSLEPMFIVGSVNRNQPRKRWDLTIQYFANWIYQGMPRQLRNEDNARIKDAALFLHCAPTGEDTIHVKELCRYYGILSRLALSQPQVWYGLEEQDMVVMYNCFDVAISTTQGEGMGLTILEAMACRKPVIVPDWSAFGDWARGWAWLVPCKSTAIGPPYINVIGGIPDEELFIRALDTLYHNHKTREHNAAAALECAEQSCYRWSNIGAQVTQVLDQVTAEKSVAVTA